MTSVWTRTVYDMEFDPSRGWLMDYFKSGHLWMYCTDCGRKFGEINGSTTAHFCEAIGDVVRA